MDSVQGGYMLDLGRLVQIILESYGHVREI